MSGVFSFVQPPWQLRDRRVCYRVRNYIPTRKVAFCRQDNRGPVDLAGWNLNHVPQKAANQQSVTAVRHRMVCPCHWMFQTTLTDQVISPPAQRLDLLTTCYNPVDNYPRGLLWVARTNLVL